MKNPMKKRLLTLSIIPYLMLLCVLSVFVMMSYQTIKRMELEDLSDSLRWEVYSVGVEFRDYLHGKVISDKWERHLEVIEGKLQSLERYEMQHADEVVILRERIEILRTNFYQVKRDYVNYQHEERPVEVIISPAIDDTINKSYELSVLQSVSARTDHRNLAVVLVGAMLLIFVMKTVIVVFLNRSIGRDVESLRELERSLSKSNEELSRFVYFVSHDLREPARMVACYMKMLQEKSVLRSATRENLEVDREADELIRFAIEGAARMEALLDSLLAYARLDSELVKQDVEFCRDVVNVALRDLQSVIDASGAEVSFTCDNPDPTHCWHCRVSCDPVLMTQVFVNLVGNAIKYAKQDVPPVVRIMADRDEDEWTFCIADNGIGIESEDITENLFKLFKRLHTRDQYPGCGIGLASCKKVITRHGGRIWVESKAGVGSRFYFTLPI